MQSQPRRRCIWVGSVCQGLGHKDPGWAVLDAPHCPPIWPSHPRSSACPSSGIPSGHLRIAQMGDHIGPGEHPGPMSGDQAVPPAGAGSLRGWLRLGPRPVAALAGRRAEEPLDVSHGPPVRFPHGEHRLQPLRDAPQVIGPSDQGTPATREQGDWGAKTPTTHSLVVTGIG